MRHLFITLFALILCFTGLAQEISLSCGYSTHQAVSGTVTIKNADDFAGIYSTYYQGNGSKGLIIGSLFQTPLYSYGNSYLYLGVGYADRIKPHPAAELRYMIDLSEKRFKYGIGMGYNTGMGIVYELKLGLRL